MIQDERLKNILHYLKENGKIRVDEICDLYQVSRDTARRDLVKLEEDRLIVRTHGGAMLPAVTPHVHRYEERLADRDVKQQIGRYAASFIQDGDTILLDTSTTVQWIADALEARDVEVVTNSIDIVNTLAKKPNVGIHLLGGTFNVWNRNVTGTQTVELLRNYRVQKLFIGACGLIQEGLCSPLAEEAYTKREMIRRADLVIVLADKTKFNKTFLHHVCGLEEIDILITDREPPKLMKETLVQHGVQLIVVNGGEEDGN
jgi:DeoR family transcriptional regulator, carbon catabolite repression regulator